jgi:hypothetical protein
VACLCSLDNSTRRRPRTELGRCATENMKKVIFRALETFVIETSGGFMLLSVFLKAMMPKFYVLRTVHYGMKLYNDHRNAQFLNLFIYLLLPYMFRAFF